MRGVAGWPILVVVALSTVLMAACDAALPQPPPEAQAEPTPTMGLTTDNEHGYVCESMLTPPPAGEVGDGEPGFATTNLGMMHIRPPQAPTYGFCPPTSGEHYSAAGLGPIRPAAYGPHERPSPGGWVHNLEHGYVVALYRCPSPAHCPADDELLLLERFFDEVPSPARAPHCDSKVIVAPFDTMPTRFALVAWDRALLTDEFDLAEALAFAERWLDHEGVPERGLC
jgi:hypothetical protein